MPIKSSSPLAPSVVHDALDWDHVEPTSNARADQDILGLSAADRAALGLSTLRTQDAQPTILGDAHEALAEVLAHGAAVGKTAERPRRR